ncbi:YtxH domain-containing protein [Streptomyces sp. NBC_00669]|uniref:YtxH domain-containing protein n=1 Tax=unclassified Streptomyces TaxID=2593676 RepID=UPI002E1DFE86|nr:MULTISPECIES: YtxH domain-containing protein [unclassified Streptomyces]
MRYRLTFITGALVGFVLGARAGRERYEQIREAARKLAQNPAVRNTAESAMQQGRTAAGKAKETVTAKVGDRMPDALAGKMRAGRNGNAPDSDWGTSNT